MNWVKKQKLPATKAIKFNGHPYNKLEDLQKVLYQFFNLAQDRLINFQFLDKIPSCKQSKLSLFSKARFINAISKCSSLSVLDLDHIFWNHLKALVDNAKCVVNIVNIVNLCIDLGYWLLHFKKSMSIIIPKLNKLSYDTSKTF